MYFNECVHIYIHSDLCMHMCIYIDTDTHVPQEGVKHLWNNPKPSKIWLRTVGTSNFWEETVASPNIGKHVNSQNRGFEQLASHFLGKDQFLGWKLAPQSLGNVGN